MQTIKAAILHEIGQPLVIENITIRAPHAGEVEVKVDAVAICQSDISYIDGGFPCALPAVMGHEAAGRVTAIGDGVTGLALGDAVVVTLIRACGTCPSCQAAHPVICETPHDPTEGPITTTGGAALYQGLNCGAFAEKVVVDHSQVVRLPEGIPMDAAALLACGVITGVGSAVNVAKVRPGQSVVVIGAGGVGLNAIQGARMAGATRIIAVDMSPGKLDDAKAFGATDGVLASEEKPWNAVKRLNSGRGADAVFVTVGLAPVYDSAHRYLAPGGNMVMVGLPHARDKASYSPLGMANAGQSILGSMMGDAVIGRDIPWLVEMYRQGRLMLDELISGRYRLDEINEAIASTKSGTARRNVIVMRD
jgi:Zn-dependent alcohol dehydrogenase